MNKIPNFKLYGIGNLNTDKEIQPELPIRNWNDLSTSEKEICLQQLKNSGWINEYSREILQAIEHLNYHFLRQCPGKYLHNTKPENNFRISDDEYIRTKNAYMDFRNIFLNEKSDAMVFRMITKFAEGTIDKYSLQDAEKTQDEDKLNKSINEAFDKFDRLMNCFNHIFEQFSVNAILTRNGLVPRQDKKIIEEIYTPTLHALSDPKWKSVNNDLVQMFDDYQQKKYPEVITKAHRTIQRFLQISVGEEGKNSKGELAILFRQAKERGLLPVNKFTELIINAFQGYIPSERATKSTAKPAKIEATSSDALLMMNVVLVFLQYCLQKTK